jgi:hypothetical protein
MKCVFFEIDSILPEKAEWAQFLKDKHYKVKTIRLRGVISQGLALPLSTVSMSATHSGEEGTDLLWN